MEGLGLNQLAEFFTGRRVLVTGASGFLGANLTRHLLTLGAEVWVLLRPNKDFSRLADILPRLKVVYANLCQSRKMRRMVATAQPEVVFHLAAAGVSAGANDAAKIVETNVLGTLNLLEAVKPLSLQRFIYVGSCFEYGEGETIAEDHPLAPTGAYGASKAAGTLLCQTYHRTHGLPVVVVRPFTPYGPWEHADRLIPSVIRCALQGEDVALTKGEQERDFVYVTDVVAGLLSAAVARAAVGAIINLCSGEGTPIRQVVSKILTIMGDPVKPLLGARPYREGEMWHMSGDNTRARQLLNWQTQTNLDDGLEKTVAWFRAHRIMAGN